MSSQETTTKGRPGRPRTKKSTEATKTLDRGLYLLEELGDQRLSLSEISRRTSLHPSTASRLIRTLCTRGFVIYDEKEGLYRLGSRLMGLAGSGQPHKDLLEAARPVLERLRDEFDETVNLIIREGTEVVYLDSVESRQPLRMFTEVGARVPLHTCASGKALLMGLPDDDVRAIFQSSGPLKRFTANTITDIDRLIPDIRTSEARGYALDIGERQEGVLCVAAAFHLENCPPASISISGPQDRIPTSRQSVIGKRIIELTSQLQNTSS